MPIFLECFQKIVEEHFQTYSMKQNYCKIEALNEKIVGEKTVNLEFYAQ